MVFRTLESWKKLLVGAGFDALEVREPIHPGTGRPASVIFIASGQYAEREGGGGPAD